MATTVKTKTKKTTTVRRKKSYRPQALKLCEAINKLRDRVYKLKGKAESSYGENCLKDSLKHLTSAAGSLREFY